MKTISKYVSEFNLDDRQIVNIACIINKHKNRVLIHNEIRQTIGIQNGVKIYRALKPLLSNLNKV